MKYIISKPTLVVIFLFLFANQLHAQYELEWIKLAGDSTNFRKTPTKIAVDTSGNIIICSWVDVTSSYTNVSLIKYSPNGNLLWSVQYGGIYDNAPTDMEIDSAGNIYITGSINAYEVSDSARIVTLKYNSAGVLQWDKIYPNLNSIGSDLALDNNGNVYVTGSYRKVGLDFDIILIKYNSTGDTVLVKHYNNPISDYDYPAGVKVDKSGNIYIGGYSHLASDLSVFTLIKYNPAGVQQWVRNYKSGDAGVNRVYAMCLDTLGNIYLSGTATASPLYEKYFATIKYNSNGDSLWVKKYNYVNTNTALPSEVQVDKSGNVYVCGTDMTAFGITLKYSSSGILLFASKYTGAVYSSAIDNSGNVFVTGNDGLSSQKDVVTIKYDQFGDSVWVRRYTSQNTGGPSADVGFTIAVYNGDIYVAGMQRTNVYRILTLKYGMLTSAEQTTNITLTDYSLSQNYPNPFNPYTIISYNIPEQGFVKLSVYDILGKEIQNLINEHKPAGSHKVNWNAENYPSGIYFYKLQVNNYSEIKRMVLIK